VTTTSGDGRPSAAVEAREPKYYVLKTYLLEMTRTQPPGTPVPSERILAEDFSTSRTTVRQALQELVGEGRLQRLQGKGTFVARPKIAQPLVLSSYTEDMQRRGAKATSRLLALATEPADADVAERLAVEPGARLVRLERLRLTDGEPMAVEQSRLSADRFPGLEAEETIETGTASPVEAALLGTETGLPVLLLGRQTFDADGRPFEYVRSIYRGDRFKLVARLSRP
jgi:GntR family transcriptional regulator